MHFYDFALDNYDDLMSKTNNNFSIEKVSKELEKNNFELAETLSCISDTEPGKFLKD